MTKTIDVPNVINRNVQVDLNTQTEVAQVQEKVVENQVNIDVVLEKNIEVIREVKVDVPVEKVVEVEVGVTVNNPVFREVVNQEEIVVETVEDEVQMVTLPDEYLEIEDGEFRREITSRKSEIEKLRSENESKRRRLELVQKRFVDLRSNFTSVDEQSNIRMKARLSELRSRLANAGSRKTKLVRKSMNRN